MKILTSLAPAPNKSSVQHLSINSWKALGFDVVSLNCPAEINKLKNEFDVEFCPVNKTAIEIVDLDKPYIPILAFIDYIRKCNDICCITNSDIILDNKADIAQAISLSEKSIVFGNRVDIKSPEDRSGNRYDPGFDYFIVRPQFEHIFFGYRPYVFMGRPWWDYWIPLIFIRAGINPILFKRDIAYHIKHDQVWDESDIMFFGKLVINMLGLQYIDNIDVQHMIKIICDTIGKGSEIYE